LPFLLLIIQNPAGFLDTQKAFALLFSVESVFAVFADQVLAKVIG
jgi:hypothetical protein